MPPSRMLSRVSVQGLYDQFDVDLSFKPGLNIVYGKNGAGKTTVLHLIANAIECDFKRFSFLQFRRIRIENDEGRVVDISKAEGQKAPVVALDGRTLSFGEASPNLADDELHVLREVLGGRPTYLPAFRSVLERARAESTSYYRLAERRDPELDELFDREFQALVSLTQGFGATGIHEQRSLREQAAATAQKTILCRQWFGAFVPVVRYPSVADVEDGLTEEWRAAHLIVTRREQRMFEDLLVRIFRTISGLERSRSVENNEDLLTSIAALLNAEESQLPTSDSRDIYDNLLKAVKRIDAGSVASQGIETSLLEIYRQVLEKRNEERRLAFQRSREFEASMNKFLETKAVRIGQPGAGRPNSRSSVAAFASGGRPFPLAALSSGERQILTLLYSASRSPFSSGLVLIDEPELSLHIDWQRIVLRELHSQAPDRQLIACTHAPEVGADHLEAIQDFEPSITARPQGTLFPDEDA